MTAIDLHCDLVPLILTLVGNFALKNFADLSATLR
jgi:hypothetical protein